MERIETWRVDWTEGRDEWPAGEWDKEPDKLQWEDEATGLPCLIVRNHMGALCGYVGVPEGHPWWEKDYDDVPADAHGGLTYSDHCQGGVCHVPDPGEPDNVWWLGFDCAHLWDLVPRHEALFKKFREEERPDVPLQDVYRNWDYVTAEVTSLAAQAKEAACSSN